MTKPNLTRTLLCIAALLMPALRASALDISVPAVRGDRSRALLGDGTGVVIGIVDSGVDATHPALAGVDSMGQSRLVAQANFVPTEPTNLGDDTHGHGTQVASVALSSDATRTGLAPDARYINARVTDSFNRFADDEQVRDGVGFAIDSGADVLNVSLNFFQTISGGGTQLDLMLDWAAFDRGIMSAICAGNINSSGPRVRGPGGSYNGVTIGRTDIDFDQVHPESANAFTQNNRMKPDLVAPGTEISVANNNWDTEELFNTNSGCSFATPHVTGMIAQQIEAGRTLGLSTNPLVLKATQLNSASKAVLDKSGQPWSAAETTRPLDTDAGAGQVDGLALAQQYLVGEQEAGLVGAIGWDLASVGDEAFVDYAIDSPLEAGSMLTASLTWFRHVGRTDNGDGKIDSDDQFFLSEAIDNLDLQLLADGQIVAQSQSFFDNVEHLWTEVSADVSYTLRVFGNNIVGAGEGELFAVAWSATAVPEPAAIAMLTAMLFVVNNSRRHGSRPSGRDAHGDVEQRHQIDGVVMQDRFHFAWLAGADESIVGGRNLIAGYVPNSAAATDKPLDGLQLAIG